MPFGMLELILLVLSASTFLLAVCLLTWVLLKGRYVRTALKKKGDYQLAEMTSSSLDKNNTALSESKDSSSSSSSPASPGVPDTVKQHILASHPHFWDNLEKQETAKYGSFGKESGHTGLYNRNVISGDCKDFTYGTIKFGFRQLSSNKTRDVLFQLISLQAIQLNFLIKDVYLEIKCHVSSQHSLALEDLFELYSNKANGKRSILPRFVSNRQHRLKPQIGEYRFILPLSKMVDKTNVNKIMILTGSDKQEEIPKGCSMVNIESKVFMKRGNDRVYIGEGVFCNWCSQSHVTDKNLHIEHKTEERVEEGVIRNIDVHMDYIHKPQIAVGRVNISMTYLPTSEKLSLCVKEFTLNKGTTWPAADVYWKIKLIKMNKDVIRHKITVTEDQKEIEDQSKSMKWSCDKVVTFDRTQINTLLNATVVCSLIANMKRHDKNNGIDSNRTTVIDGVLYNKDKVITLTNSDKEHLKVEDQRHYARKGSNHKAKLSSCKEDGNESINNSKGIDDKINNGNIGSPRRTGSSADIVLGELYLGTCVPEIEGRELWIQVLMNTRSTVQKWLPIV